MQILLLATGEQDVLRPLTGKVPLPLLPVGDRPLLAHLVEMVARQDFTDILVSLWQQPGTIERVFGSGRRWGVNLQYVLQPEPLGSAGALKWAQRLLDGPVVVIPATQLFYLDLRAVVARHQAQNNALTLVGHPVLAAPPFYAGPGGAISISETEMTGARALAGTGVAVLEPEALALIPNRRQFDLYQDLVPALQAAGRRVGAYEMDSYWQPLDSFAGLAQAQWDLLHSARLAPEARAEAGYLPYPNLSAASTEIADGIWVGRHNAIHPSVRLTPPIFIGDSCELGPDVELGPRAVIGSASVVAAGATVRNSVILDHTYVGELVNLDGRIAAGNQLVDVQTGESIALVDTFLLGEMRPESVGSSVQQLLERLVALALLLVAFPLLLVLGLLVFLFSGRLLARVERVVPRTGGGVEPGAEEKCRLFRFYTRRPAGSFIGPGRWLEAWELHRLPELWNVVRGELALVGVKALTPDERQQMDAFWEESWQAHPAGFTGLWYVQPGIDTDDMDQVLAAAAYYTATRTWREDVRLCLKTPFAWRRHRHDPTAGDEGSAVTA